MKLAIHLTYYIYSIKIHQKIHNHKYVTKCGIGYPSRIYNHES